MNARTSVRGKLILRKRSPVNTNSVAFRNMEDIYVEGTELPRYSIYTPNSYKDGPEGFIKWAEENVCIPIYPEGSDISVWCPIKDLPKEKNSKTGRSYRDFWEEQKRVARNCLRMIDGRFVYKLIILCWMRGEGKCQVKGSKVLMFDGTIKKVEDVKVGDLLMGDDNNPRRVLSLASGVDEMFKVTPMKGESFTVTGDHILSLKGRRRFVNRDGAPYYDPNEDVITDISLNDYMQTNDSFKRYHLLFKVPVEFPEQDVEIDPYFLGLWLGDGNSNTPSITTMDKEVVDFLQTYANQLGMMVSVRGKKGSKAKLYNIVAKKRGLPGMNHLLNLLRKHNLLWNKHIPQEYKANSRKNRLSLLAGIVDTDGYVNRNSVQITIKGKRFSDDIAFLARSLGFHVETKRCTKCIKSTGFRGTYYRIGISGDCSIIPTRISRKKISVRRSTKDVLVTGIKKIKSVGKKEYYGFTLDGNGRYIMGDFTVTHNSLFACLIQLWKFFNWTRQNIVLGANSKEQITFVHYDIMRDIILNSPNLLLTVGKKNVQEKQIRIKDKNDNIVNVIRAISSFSGIVSNITGYTFSEIFDMKNPKFFTQLDGSIRNIPNALGVIDSTVSGRDHILYNMFSSFVRKKIKTLYFSYRMSKTGDYRDYWNPNMDQQQLDDYRAKFLLTDFERYFLNMWGSSSQKIFLPHIVDSMLYIGCDNKIGNFKEMMELLEQRQIRIDACDNLMTGSEDKSVIDGSSFVQTKRVEIHEINERLIPLENYYKLTDGFNPCMATMDDLDKMGDLFDTDWAILAGIDRADPMKTREGGARTVVTCIAKGLPGSRSHFQPYDEQGNKAVPNYLYLLLHLAVIENNSLESIKEALLSCNEEFDGLDALCGERWGVWDIVTWCEEQSIKFEVVFPNYDKQRAAFSELYVAVKNGRFKAPVVHILGMKEQDILREEMRIFYHDTDKRWFGSPEKNEKEGIQDDSMFSIAWCLYGGRELGVDAFRRRKKKMWFGTLVQEKMLGNYA